MSSKQPSVTGYTTGLRGSGWDHAVHANAVVAWVDTVGGQRLKFAGFDARECAAALRQYIKSWVSCDEEGQAAVRRLQDCQKNVRAKYADYDASQATQLSIRFAATLPGADPVLALTMPPLHEG